MQCLERILGIKKKTQPWREGGKIFIDGLEQHDGVKFPLSVGMSTPTQTSQQQQAATDDSDNHTTIHKSFIVQTPCN